MTSPGETVSTTIKVYKPQLGRTNPPPSAVNEACNFAEANNTSEYIHGLATISYKGTIPGDVVINLSDQSVVELGDILYGGGDSPTALSTATSGGAPWDCQDQDQWSYDMPADSVTTIEWWTEVQALSNAHPNFTAADRAALALSWYAMGSDQLESGKLSLSGPGVAICENQATKYGPYLLAYARAPRTYALEQGDGSLACRKP